MDFSNLTKYKYYNSDESRRLNHQFVMKNGHAIPKEFANCHMSLMNINQGYFDDISYNRRGETNQPIFLPHFAIFDKKCLSFSGYFKYELNNFGRSQLFIRRVNLIYYLEDDTIKVFEPPVTNAGYTQGKLVNRGRIRMSNTNKYWHWKDLNVAMDIEIYGTVYRLFKCDDFTKDFYEKNGIKLNECEEIPMDESSRIKSKSVDCLDADKPSSTEYHDKLYRFLHYDKKVLRYYALWEDGVDCPTIEKNIFKICYYLVDDTIEITEITKNKYKEKSAFTRFLRRMRIRKESPAQSEKDDELASNSPNSNCHEKYYQVEDFIIGNEIHILGRKFMIYDCDQFTRQYWKETLNREQPEPININEESPKKENKAIPPHIGIGNPEDTLRSCLNIIPRVEQKRCILREDNVKLNFLAILVSSERCDKNRKFIFSISLWDNKISIYEKKFANSGFPAGIYLKAVLVPYPDCTPEFPQYYSCRDIYIDATINVFGRKFKIVGTDLKVYQYMTANRNKFTDSQIESVKKHLRDSGLLEIESEEVIQD